MIEIIKEENELMTNDLVFAKVKSNAIIPTKDDENAGRDVYACFDEDYIVIPAFTTKLIPTGIASAMTSKYEIRLRDRGSNGSKGIHVNAGSIDSGFRGEWFVAWCNTNDKQVVLSKLTEEELINRFIGSNKEANKFLDDKIKFIDHNNNDFIYDVYNNCFSNSIFYPYTKAIAQAEVCEVPIMNQYEITYDELLKISSKRGTGMLGSSGK